MRLLHIAPLAIVSASIVACAVASPSSEDSSESGSAITGSLALLQSCSAAATYSSDGPNDFDVPAEATIPASVKQAAQSSPAASIGHFKAPSVGDVYVVSNTYDSLADAIWLYDRNGASIAIGYQFDNAWSWLSGAPAGGAFPLDCSGTPYNVNPWPSNSSSSGSSGSWGSSGDDGDCDGGSVVYDDAGNVTATTCSPSGN